MEILQNPAVQDTLLLGFILNPFAQALFMSELMRETELGEFRKVFTKATGMTWVIFIASAFIGELVLSGLFKITISAMRVFGGIINLSLAYSYIIRGPEGLKLFRGEVTELAQQITLPVMVGAGVIWATMKIGRTHSVLGTLAIISFVLIANLFFIFTYHRIFKAAKSAMELAIVKYFGMAMRINAMLIGAVSIEMIIGGIIDYISQRPTVAL